jgi:hypothetical protein
MAAPEADTDREAMTGADCAAEAAEASPTPLITESTRHAGRIMLGNCVNGGPMWTRLRRGGFY